MTETGPGRRLGEVVDDWRRSRSPLLTLVHGPAGGGDGLARWIARRLVGEHLDDVRHLRQGVRYRSTRHSYEVWDLIAGADEVPYERGLPSEVVGVRRVVLATGRLGRWALVPPARIVDVEADVDDMHQLLAELLVATGMPRATADALANRYSPATQLVDELAGFDGSPEDVIRRVEEQSVVRRLAERIAVDHSEVLDLGRVLLLLRPRRVELSDEWAQLASSLAGRPVPLAEVSRVLVECSWLFSVHRSGPAGVVRPKHPLAERLLEGMVPLSESEHYALYQALRERAYDTLRSRDSSDKFVAEQLPRQAMASFSFSDLFQDALAVLCSDVTALVREIERDPARVLHPGAKAVLLCAHRLREEPTRASSLELSALRVGLVDFARAVQELLPNRPWRTLWTRSQPVNANRVILDQPAPALAFATSQVRSGAGVVGASDGRTWIVTPYGHARCVWGDSEAVGEVRAVGLHCGLDGSLVAALATSDQQVVVIDVDARKVLWKDDVSHQAPLSALAIGAEPSALLATSGVDGVVRIVDLMTGSPPGDAVTKARSVDVGVEVRSLQFVATDRGVVLLYATVDGSLGMIDPLAGELVSSHPVTESVLNCVSAVTSAESLVAAVGTSDGHVYLVRLDPGSGAPTAAPVGVTRHSGSVNGVHLRFWRDELVVLAASSDRTWSMTDVEGQAPGDRIEGHFGPLWDIGWLEIDDRELVVTVGGDGCCRVWVPDAVLRESLQLEKPTRHSGPVTAIEVEETDGELSVWTGGADGELRSWAATATSSGRPLVRHNRAISTVVFGDRDETGSMMILSASVRGELYKTDVVGGTVTQRTLLGIAHDGVMALALGSIDDESVLVSGGQDGAITVWSLLTETPLATTTACRYGAVTAVCVLERNAKVPLVAVGSQDGSLTFRRLQPLDELWRHDFDAPVSSISPLPYHNAGLVIGLASGDVEFVRDARHGAQEWSRLGSHEADVTGLAAFMTGGRLVVASAGLDRRVRLWDVSTRLVLQEIELDGLALDVSAVNSHVGVATTAGAAVFTFSEDALILAATL